MENVKESTILYEGWFVYMVVWINDLFNSTNDKVWSIFELI